MRCPSCRLWQQPGRLRGANNESKPASAHLGADSDKCLRLANRAERLTIRGHQHHPRHVPDGRAWTDVGPGGNDVRHRALGGGR